MIKAGIVGGTGYTGVELLRLLAQHPQVEIAAITSRKEAGTAVSAMFPSLRGRVALAGQVGSVDVPGGKLVMVPRRYNPLIVAERIVTSAEVRVNSGTLVYRDESGAQRVTIPLDQVRAGERAWVVGTVDASGIVSARWVRVRSQ